MSLYFKEVSELVYQGHQVTTELIHYDYPRRKETKNENYVSFCRSDFSIVAFCYSKRHMLVTLSCASGKMHAWIRLPQQQYEPKRTWTVKNTLK